jgi:uncharacterized RDD family membrane protein YckC
MSEQPPQPPPPAPGPAGGQPVPGVPRPGELLDRFLARLIDGILLAIVFGIVFSVLTAIIVTGIRSTGELFLLALIYSIISVAAYIAYYAIFESGNGATLGKQLMKLRVVAPDGVSKPTMEQAVRRNLWYAVGLIGIIPIAGGFLGTLASIALAVYIAVTINSDTVNRQGWHDRFAGGTRVLKIG